MIAFFPKYPFIRAAAQSSAHGVRAGYVGAMSLDRGYEQQGCTSRSAASAETVANGMRCVSPLLHGSTLSASRRIAMRGGTAVKPG